MLGHQMGELVFFDMKLKRITRTLTSGQSAAAGGGGGRGTNV